MIYIQFKSTEDDKKKRSKPFIKTQTPQRKRTSSNVFLFLNYWASINRLY